MRKIFTLLSFLLFISGITYAQCGTFHDGFESGSYIPTWTSGSGYTPSVVTTSPAVGTYCFQLTGTSSHHGGPTTTFTPSQPTNVSWYVKSSTSTLANGYFVIGDANTTSNNGIAFAYVYQTGVIRFYANSSNSLDVPISYNTWYKVEMRNINWVAKTFDIYVDNVLRQANFPFRSTASTSMSHISLYNISTSTTSWYDHITVGGVPIIITPTSADPTCPGTTDGSISVTASGGTPNYSYLWSTGSTTNSISNVGAGTYNVVVTDSNGCVDSTSFTLTDPPALTSSFTMNEPDCNGDMNGSVAVSASGGTGSTYAYLWNTGGTTSSLTGVGAGTYTVMITDSNGCTLNDTTTLSEPSQLAVTSVPTDPGCAGDTTGMISTTVSGGTPGYLYAWSTGAFTPAISGLTAGGYAVTVTDTNGCQNGDTIYLVDPPALTLALSGSDVSCAGQTDGSITATGGGGNPGYTYLWSNGASGATASGLSAGTYSVVMTDASGCWTSDTVTIAEPTAISGSGTVTDEINGNGNGSVDFTATGGNLPYSYAWSNGATTEDLTNISAGTYTVTVTDANGCTFVDTFIVDMITGIAPGQQGPEVSVFPNPAENLLNIQLEGAEQILTLEIVAMDGRVLKALRSEGNAARNEQFNVADLAAGVYLLRISSESGTAFVRWTKQ